MVGNAAVIAEAGRPAGTRPELRRRDGIPIIVYRRTRVFVDREAWEMLPDGGVLLMQVHPANAPAYALAFTAAELERAFGHVRKTKSWETVRHYHFPTAPTAVSAFRVTTTGSTEVDVTSMAPTTSASSQHGEHSARLQSRRAPRTMRAPTISGSSLYEWATAWATQLGVPAESEAYLGGVGAWRRAWRPERVKVLLVAESHVAESPNDRNAVVNTPRWLDRQFPSQFVRLVYCLGYGEPTLCRVPKPTANGGTWQFWDIFGQIARGYGAHNRQPRSGASTPERRIRWKVEVLKRLQARGIWLEDASPIGLYRTGGGRLLSAGNPLYRQLLRDGYKRFVWPEVSDDDPRQVWEVGGGVASALVGLPGIQPDRSISQPQAARTPEQRQRFEQALAAMCTSILHAAP